MSVDVQRIDRCRSCGTVLGGSLLSLGSMPLTDKLLTRRDLAAIEPLFRLDVTMCRECSLVLLLDTVSPELMFRADYHYFSSYSDVVVENARLNVCDRIAEQELTSDDLIIELGCNDGYLPRHYLDVGIPVLGIDPALQAVQVASSYGIPTRGEFFTAELADRLAGEGLRASVIHANNVLAHVPDLNGFVAGIATLLKDDGVAVIEVPYLANMLAGVEFDTIYHEHLCYFSATAADRLFRRHGLSLNRIEHLDIHGGSLRFFVGHRSERSPLVDDLMRQEKEAGLTRPKILVTFAEEIDRTLANAREMLHGLRARGLRIAGYGAAAKGTVFLNLAGIGHETVSYVIDRNPHKQGRYLPGVRIPIRPPTELVKDRPDVVLILAWNITDEIMESLSDFCAQGGSVVTVIPEPTILWPETEASQWMTSA